MPSNLADVGWLLPAPSFRSPGPTDEACRIRTSQLYTDTASRVKQTVKAEPQTTPTAESNQLGSHAEEIQDPAMFCRFVGAGNSLLLLLGDIVESKGRFSILNCFHSDSRFAVMFGWIFPRITKRRWTGPVRCHDTFPYFGGAAFCNCIVAVGSVIKGLGVCVGRQ